MMKYTIKVGMKMSDKSELSINDDFPYEYIIGGSDKLSADYIVEQFKSSILSDKFPAGYMLPNENTLCEKLGVSRSTLREAFKVLSSYGLITRTKHGTYINGSEDFNSSLVLDYHFECSDIMEMLEFRKIFEPELAYLAAQNADTDDIMELKKLIMKIKGLEGNPSALSYNDVAFHSMIARCTHNRLFISIMKLVSDTYYKGIKMQFETIDQINDLPPVEATIYYHNRIFDSILLKDSKAAAIAMKEHMEATIKSVEKQKNMQE